MKQYEFSQKTYSQEYGYPDCNEFYTNPRRHKISYKKNTKY